VLATASGARERTRKSRRAASPPSGDGNQSVQRDLWH
jgi:hypothetical protein